MKSRRNEVIPIRRSPLPHRPASVSSANGAKTVLVIDDDENFRQAVGQTFRMEGCTVHEAGNVEEVLAVLSRVEFDAVFSDFRMPGNGHTVAHYLKQLRVEAPLVIVSGDPPGKGVDLAAPVVAWMLKPVSTAQLRHMLQMLSVRRRRRHAS